MRSDPGHRGVDRDAKEEVAMPDGTALAGKHQIRPLPFNPARLKGLSFGQPLLVLDMSEHSYAIN